MMNLIHNSLKFSEYTLNKKETILIDILIFTLYNIPFEFTEENIQTCLVIIKEYREISI